MRGAWMLGLGGGLLAGWACSVGAFACGDDSQCEGADADGVCADGYCAFPSVDCVSGLQYGEHAGDLSGRCVPEGGSSGVTGSAGSGGSGEGSTSGPDSATSVADDSTPLDSSSDGGPPGQVVFTDDELRGEFGAGQPEGVDWLGDRLGLPGGVGEGRFTSRVFDAGVVVDWQSIEWMPDAPYGKPLPDDGASETGYVQGGANMDGSVLLMHFDGDGVWGDGTPVPDSSGAGNDGVVVSDGGPIELVLGVFGTALDDHSASRISIPTDDGSSLAFGEGDFTWSLWFRMDEPCTQNHVYMGVDNSDAGDDPWPHLWLGCTDDPWDECAGKVNDPRVGGVFRSQHSVSGDGGFYCSQSAVSGDVWRHVAAVKRGHADASLALYVDGQLEYEGEASFAGPIEYPDGPDFTIGAFSRGTYPAVGVFDEAAVWARALDDDEIFDLYHRGRTELAISVRVCEQPDCADEPPFAARFEEPESALSPGSVIPLSDLPVGRYIQYRVDMASASLPDAPGPALRSVTLRGQE